MLLPFNFQLDPYVILDFSASNPDLTLLPLQPNGRSFLDLTNTSAFTHYVFGKLRAAGAKVGVGGYNEHRVIYRRSEHFQQTPDGKPLNHAKFTSASTSGPMPERPFSPH
jgi:hypothetical protein